MLESASILEYKNENYEFGMSNNSELTCTQFLDSASLHKQKFKPFIMHTVLIFTHGLALLINEHYIVHAQLIRG